MEFCDKGAAIYSIKYNDTMITYQPEDKKTFVSEKVNDGKSIGRVAGRIQDGYFKLDGNQYNLTINENVHDEKSSKYNTLHSGPESISTKIFTREIKDETDFYSISFNYLSPDMECGFPNEIDIWIKYYVYKNEAKILLDIEATPKTEQKTPLNFTNHTYFRLSNDGNILNHYLTVPTDTIAKYNFESKNQIVVGKIKVNDEYVKKDGVEPFNFQTKKKIGQDVKLVEAMDSASNGYDHIWCTDNKNPLGTITLENDKLKLEITTDADAAAIYCDSWPRTGVDTQYGAIAIEPQTYWVRGNDGEIPDDSDILYTHSKPFKRQIIYKISDI